MMEPEAGGIQGTPPHQPTYNVRVSEQQIRSIVALVFPSHDLKSYKQLESGKSFNNRIYFIETRSRATSSHTQLESSDRSLVLKVSGHYFGARKVQNEVGSLLLMNRYCPSIPTADVVAWSEDGSMIQTIDGRSFNAMEDQDALSVNGSNAFSKYGWILTTRMPGRLLSAADLDGPHGRFLIKEVARCLASWRSAIPSPPGIGCIRFLDPSERPHSDFVFETSVGRIGVPSTIKLTVGGLILCQRYDPAPLPTALAYYTYLLEDQLYYLQSLPMLKPLSVRILTKVQALIKDLPRLSFFKSRVQPNCCDTVTLTHLDFAPRNMLILDESSDTDAGYGTGTPKITGILDFEFAGFLPHVEEFINMTVRQPDDWSPGQYKLLIQELARIGCHVPCLPSQRSKSVRTKPLTESCMCSERGFEGLSLLVEVIDNVKPWYLIQEGSHTEEQMQSEIQKAVDKVISGIEGLGDFML